jgi:hypothetical protein
LVREAVRLTGTQKRTAELLVSWGFTGRGGERIGESTISGWFTGRNAPPAREVFALALHHGISVDEALYGVGLRAEVDRLAAGEAQRERDLATMRQDVLLLRDIVTASLGGQLPPEQAERLGRIAGPEPAAG